MTSRKRLQESGDLAKLESWIDQAKSIVSDPCFFDSNRFLQWQGLVTIFSLCLGVAKLWAWRLDPEAHNNAQECERKEVDS